MALWQKFAERSPCFAAFYVTRAGENIYAATLRRLVDGAPAGIFEEMGEPFDLADPQDAQEFLFEFPADTRRRGQASFRRGVVQGLTCIEPGRAYKATVMDGRHFEVELSYCDENGWWGDCTCPQDFGCTHMFAAMSALLAEHRSAIVRDLTSPQTGSQARLAVLKSRSESKETGGLMSAFLTAHNRAPNKEEARFLQTLHSVYVRCRQQQRATIWDFQQLGLEFTNGRWEGQAPWQHFPETEQEFWLYVALIGEQVGWKIPKFMEPLTQLEPVREKLARWQRQQEIERWERTLANQPLPDLPSLTLEPAQIDLRLMIGSAGVHVQWLRPGQAGFDTPKATPFREFCRNWESGTVHLIPEAELLWQLYRENHYSYTAETVRRYDSGETSQWLRRVLRLPVLASRVVSAAGQPLERPVEPLRWKLTAPADPEADYLLRLVQANGDPAPATLCVLPGQPTLYLTATAVFVGPQPRRHVLDPAAINRIPAAALEQISGLTFLQNLEVELPPQLSARIITLGYHITIHCALRPASVGTNAEECLVTVRANAPDGHQQIWTGFNWLVDQPPSKPKQKQRLTRYDTASLRQAASLLEPLALKPAYSGHGLVLRVTKKFPELFATWLKSLPPHFEVRLDGELASLVSADVAGSVRLEATEAEIDWFDLRVVLQVGDATLTPEEIKLLLNAKGGYVRLKDKGWRRLQYQLSPEEDERLAQLGLNPRELSAEPQRLHALQLADPAARKFMPAQQVEQLQRRASELKARVTPQLPGGITAQLRPYQLEGFHFLAYLSTNRFGGILADDMGLGKTLQTLAWLVWLRMPASTADAAARPSLVVCPKSVMDNWQAEAARFAPGLRVRVWSSGTLEQLPQQHHDADLHVLNYAQLRLLGGDLNSIPWLAVILDEGQNIKNPGSQTAQVARQLRAEHRLVLSGTPIENRLMDLWSLMAFAMPGALGNRNQFGRLYGAKDDSLARRRLAARVRPFVLRRTKAQVASDLPDRIEEDLLCEMEGEQASLYRAELKQAQQRLLGIHTQAELAQQQFHFLTSLLRLRQVCCDHRLVKPDAAGVSAKVEALFDQLEPLMAEGQKVLVFSQFVSLLNLLRVEIKQRDWPAFYLAGETEDRGELVREFQAAEGPAVFLISLKAGGFGLNLTAASYVVLFDPWWNPAVENQAIDRTHRIGQTQKVIAYRLLIKNSIEEKIRALQRQKRALAEDVLGEEKFSQSLTLADLQFLFAD